MALSSPINICDACAGFGMLGEAVHQVFELLGIESRSVVAIERDAAAAAAYVARMEKTPLGCPPVWDDLATFDGRAFRGCVDIICAGLPCQPYSLAGKRIGNADHRSHGEDGEGPIPHFLRIVEESNPSLVFLENVPAWVVGGHFRTVGEELCRMGFTLEEPVFIAASDVGAPHERERVFILAHRLDDAQRDEWREHFARRGSDRGGIVGRTDKEMANGSGTGRDRGEERYGGDGSSGTQHRRDDERCDSQLALSPRGGLGIAGESSERDGFIDLREPELADGASCRRRTQGNTESRDRPRDIDEGRIELGNSGGTAGERDGGGVSGPEGESGRGGEPDGDSAIGPPIASEHIYREGVGNAMRLGKCEPEHVDAGWPRADSWRDDIGPSGNLPLFPPGRGDESNPWHPDFAAWAVIAAVDFTVMPRVEPAIPVVADGLGFSRSDLLRIGGNGVVPVCAAMAFYHLLLGAISKCQP